MWYNDLPRVLRAVPPSHFVGDSKKVWKFIVLLCCILVSDEKSLQNSTVNKMQ